MFFNFVYHFFYVYLVFYVHYAYSLDVYGLVANFLHRLFLLYFLWMCMDLWLNFVFSAITKITKVTISLNIKLARS